MSHKMDGEDVVNHQWYALSNTQNRLQHRTVSNSFNYEINHQNLL